MTFAMMIMMDYWWFAIPGLILGMYAQYKLTSTYGRYLKVPTDAGISGAEAARIILDRAGLHNVPVEVVPGHLSDHYDPRHRKLCLSQDNYHGRSLSSVGVAAHEAGHALQHKDAYTWLNLRMAMVPVTQFASYAYYGIAILGLISGLFMKFLGIIIAIFTVIWLFQLITLPVEFNASTRAKRELMRLGLISNDEERGVSKVLNAAAMTYVAAMVTSALELLKFIMIARGSSRD